MVEVPGKKVLSVSQLNRMARQLLESDLPVLWVEGEISNLARPASGHLYFSLKDDRAQIRCALFRGRGRNTDVSVANEWSRGARSHSHGSGHSECHRRCDWR